MRRRHDASGIKPSEHRQRGEAKSLYILHRLSEAAFDLTPRNLTEHGVVSCHAQAATISRHKTRVSPPGSSSTRHPSSRIIVARRSLS